MADTPIPIADLPVVTPGDFDYVVGTQLGNPRRFLVSSLTAAVLAMLAAPTGADVIGYQPPGDGAYAQIVSDWLNNTVNVLAYIDPDEHAAIRAGTSTYDCRAGIQAAINYAIYAGGKMKVHAPGGIYNSSGEIYLGYGTSFTSIVFEGDGSRYASQAAFCGTAIIFSHNDAPGISFQGARRSVIRGMAIKGANFNYVSSNGLGDLAPAFDDLNASVWVDPALPASASSRYAPYAGIAIDPRSGAKPATAYPDVDYPASLGVVAQYNKSFSSNVLLDDVIIDGFVVGLANQPCDADGNGDFTKLHRVQITCCQYGVSIGNGQSRLFHIDDCVIDKVHTGIVTTKHGRQIGKPSILVTSSHFGDIIKWIDAPNTSHGGGPCFISCYGETVYSIGNVGTGSISGYPTIFTDCEFAFEKHAVAGAPAYIFENNGPGPVTFDACTFKNAKHYAINSSILGAANLILRGGTVEADDPTDLYEKFALNATGGITLNALPTDHPEFSFKTGNLWNLDTGARTGFGAYGAYATGPRTACLGVRADRIGAGGGDAGVPVRLQSPYTISKSGKAISISGRDVTIDTGQADWQFMQRGFGVGDVVWDDETKATFYVRSRTGSTIIMRAVTGFDGSGNLLAPVTTAGNLYSHICRFYTPSNYLMGDATAVSAILTNCKRPDGSATYDAQIAVGDYLRQDNGYEDTLFGPNVARVTARDQSAGTITMAGNASRTLTRARLALWIRVEAPNA